MVWEVKKCPQNVFFGLFEYFDEVSFLNMTVMTIIKVNNCQVKLVINQRTPPISSFSHSFLNYYFPGERCGDHRICIRYFLMWPLKSIHPSKQFCVVLLWWAYIHTHTFNNSGHFHSLCVLRRFTNNATIYSWSNALNKLISEVSTRKLSADIIWERKHEPLVIKSLCAILQLEQYPHSYLCQ